MAILQKNIDKATLETLHQHIIKVLSKKGVKFQHAKACEMFADHGARVEGDIVYISEELLNKALSTVPSSFTVKGREPQYDVEIGAGTPVFCPAYGPVFVLRNNKRHLGLHEDLLAFAKLTQSSTALDIMNPYVLTPTDIPVDKLLMYQQAVCLKYGAKPTMSITAGYEATKAALQLTKAINSRHADDYVAIGLLNALSPLSYDETMVGAIFALAEEKQPMVIGCYGLPGATVPASFTGALITTTAEILAGIVLAQLLTPGVPCLTGNVSGSTDMRFITPAIGSPESARFAVFTKALSEYYGIPCRGGGSFTDAKEVDYGAGSDSALSMLSTMAAGMDYIIHAVGILDSFNIVGYEKFILDEQSIAMIKCLLKDCTLDADSIAMDVIMEVPHGGQSLEHTHTLEHMHELYAPALSLRGYYEPWQQAGAISLMEQANKAIDERLATYQLPELDAEKTALLDKYLVI